MKNWIISILTGIVFILVGWFANVAWNLPRNSNPVAVIKPHPLEKYTINNLKNGYPAIPSSSITIGKILKDTPATKTSPGYTSYEFTYGFDPTFTNGPKRTVSGLINIPKGSGPFPLIVMFRGFVDQTQYIIGMGTQHAGEYFASNGFITVAPDFLGYADSDKESSDIFESRFQTYTTGEALFKSLDSINSWDKKNIFIWAHSNGGQVALTDLEISGANYPTVLWAPNSAKFPYSLLYYLDEAPDQGKLIVTKLAEFMADYDVSLYAFNNYLSYIRAPLHMDQGTSDDAVPVLWNDNLTKSLTKQGVKVEFVKYPGSDHNLQPAWSTVVANDLQFYKDNLAK